MSKRTPLPSAHDVARLAGVSQAAVSRAFTPGASIASATRDKVLEAAKVLGYRPNLLARSLIKGQSGIIGVVIGAPRYPFFLAALAALSARMSKAGKHILVYTAEGDTTVDVLVENLLEYRVEALFLMAAGLSPRLAQQCVDEGVPVITFNLPAGPLPGFFAVNGDHVTGGASIAEHMLRQGYRQFAFMAGPPGSRTSQDRESGFDDYLAAEGLPPPLRAVGHFQREAAVVATRSLLMRKDRPDAIFCANDHMALAAIEVARFEFGLEPGRDLGIAGFDDLEESAWPSFSLTSYSLPVDALIDRVVDILLHEGGAELVPGELKIRRSTQRGAASPTAIFLQTGTTRPGPTP
jgi:DNA-binding LacI/PurR family transcriptional regulator